MEPDVPCQIKVLFVLSGHSRHPPEATRVICSKISWKAEGNLKSNLSPEHPSLTTWASWPWSNGTLFLSFRNTRLPQPAPSRRNLSLHCFKVLHRILATSFSIIHPSTLPSGIFLFYKCLSCYSLRQLNPKFAVWGNLLFLMLSFPNSDSVVWNRLQPEILLPS